MLQTSKKAAVGKMKSIVGEKNDENHRSLRLFGASLSQFPLTLTK